jgi:hypothetical protein
MPANRYFTIFGLLPVCPATGRRPDRRPRATRAMSGDLGGEAPALSSEALPSEERSSPGMRYSEIALRQGEPAAADGRLAQRESASFTPRRSLVRSQYRPPRSGRSEVPFSSSNTHAARSWPPHRVRFARYAAAQPGFSFIPALSDAFISCYVAFPAYRTNAKSTRVDT